jgi:hypothetical protein
LHAVQQLVSGLLQLLQGTRGKVRLRLQVAAETLEKP